MDITKCSGEGCPVKERCYRYVVPGDQYQSWFAEVPWDQFDMDCEYYWDAKKEVQSEA